MSARAFDDAVDYDACRHATVVDVTAMDAPSGASDRMCSDCGEMWRLSAAEQGPRASLASPVRYRRVDEPETVTTVDGDIEAQPGEYVVEHVGRGQFRVLPGWLFTMLYWVDEDPS